MAEEAEEQQPEQPDDSRGGVVGNVAGTVGRQIAKKATAAAAKKVAGSAIGTALGGPVGTVVGGLVTTLANPKLLKTLAIGCLIGFFLMIGLVLAIVIGGSSSIQSGNKPHEANTPKNQTALLNASSGSTKVSEAKTDPERLEAIRRNTDRISRDPALVNQTHSKTDQINQTIEAINLAVREVDQALETGRFDESSVKTKIDQAARDYETLPDDLKLPPLQGKLQLTPSDAAMLEEGKVDDALARYLIYLISPGDQTVNWHLSLKGAGHEHIRVDQIFTRPGSKEGSFPEALAEGNIPPTDNPHETGKAGDLSEIDFVTCKIKSLTGSKSVKFPIKVAWQSNEGLIADPPPLIEAVGGSLSDIATSVVIQNVLAGLGDLGLKPERFDWRDPTFRGFLTAVGQASFNLPYGGSGGLRENIRQLGRQSLAEWYNLPLNAFWGDQPHEFAESAGRAYLEQTLGIASHSIKGQNLEDILINTGLRYLERQFNLNPNTLTKPLPLIDLLGAGRLAQVTGLPGDTFLGDQQQVNRLINSVLKGVGQPPKSFLQTKTGEFDAALGLPAGTFEQFLKDQLPIERVRQDVGQMLFDALIQTWDNGRQADLVYNLPTGTTQLLKQGDRQGLVLAGFQVLSRALGLHPETSQTIEQVIRAGGQPNFDLTRSLPRTPINFDDLQKIFGSDAKTREQVLQRLGEEFLRARIKFPFTTLAVDLTPDRILRLLDDGESVNTLVERLGLSELSQRLGRTDIIDYLTSGRLPPQPVLEEIARSFDRQIGTWRGRVITTSDVLAQLFGLPWLNTKAGAVAIGGRVGVAVDEVEKILNGQSVDNAVLQKIVGFSGGRIGQPFNWHEWLSNPTGSFGQLKLDHLETWAEQTLGRNVSTALSQWLRSGRPPGDLSNPGQVIMTATGIGQIDDALSIFKGQADRFLPALIFGQLAKDYQIDYNDLRPLFTPSFAGGDEVNKLLKVVLGKNPNLPSSEQVLTIRLLDQTINFEAQLKAFDRLIAGWVNRQSLPIKLPNTIVSAGLSDNNGLNFLAELVRQNTGVDPASIAQVIGFDLPAEFTNFVLRGPAGPLGYPGTPGINPNATLPNDLAAVMRSLPVQLAIDQLLGSKAGTFGTIAQSYLQYAQAKDAFLAGNFSAQGLQNLQLALAVQVADQLTGGFFSKASSPIDNALGLPSGTTLQALTYLATGNPVMAAVMVLGSLFGFGKMNCPDFQKVAQAKVREVILQTLDMSLVTSTEPPLTKAGQILILREEDENADAVMERAKTLWGPTGKRFRQGIFTSRRFRDVIHVGMGL